MTRRRPGAGDPDSEPSSDYWMTYSDLMANLLLVFGLVLSVMMIISVKAQTDAETKKAELETKKAELREVQAKAQERLGIRRRIIERLRDRLAEYDVRVDQDTGAILIAAAVLFGQGEDRVTPEGKEKLGTIMEAYTAVLLGDEDFRKYLSRIIIEGHTNNDAPTYTDPYVYNLDLSQRRAFNVMKLIIDGYHGTAYEQPLEEYMVASGRSLVDLICTTGHRGKCAPGDVDKAQSRRIEIKFSLKDEDAIKELANILEGSG